MARQAYLSFDFSDFTENGLKGVIKEFGRNNLNVLSVEGNNKPKRQTGVQTKKAVFIFDDGQKLTLQITNHGVIFQVRLNSRIIPIKAVDDLKKAIAEISDKVRANSKTYQKSLSRREKAKTNTGNSGRLSNKKQLEAYQARIAELESAYKDLSERRDDVSKDLQGKIGQRQALDGEYEQEKLRNNLLLAELEQLQQQEAE